MKQSASVLLSCLITLTGHLLAQSVPGKPLAATSAATLPQPSPSAQPVRAFPYVRLWGDLRLTYVGMFSPDAEFRTPSKMAATTGHFAEEGILPASKGAQSARLRDVPESMLVSNERVVEDFEPPAHAQSVAQAHSPIGKARNRFLSRLRASKCAARSAAHRLRLAAAPRHQRSCRRCRARSGPQGQNVVPHRQWSNPAAAPARWRCPR